MCADFTPEVASQMHDQAKMIPHHVAIITDGNGRWAKQRVLPRTAGHLEGMKRVREAIQFADA